MCRSKSFPITRLFLSFVIPPATYIYYLYIYIYMCVCVCSKSSTSRPIRLGAIPPEYRMRFLTAACNLRKEGEKAMTIFRESTIQPPRFETFAFIPSATSYLPIRFIAATCKNCPHPLRKAFADCDNDKRVQVGDRNSGGERREFIPHSSLFRKILERNNFFVLRD